MRQRRRQSSCKMFNESYASSTRQRSTRFALDPVPGAVADGVVMVGVRSLLLSRLPFVRVSVYVCVCWYLCLKFSEPAGRQVLANFPGVRCTKARTFCECCFCWNQTHTSKLIALVRSPSSSGKYYGKHIKHDGLKFGQPAVQFFLRLTQTRVTWWMFDVITR